MIRNLAALHLENVARPSSRCALEMFKPILMQKLIGRDRIIQGAYLVLKIASVGSACCRAVVVFPGPAANSPKISH